MNETPPKPDNEDAAHEHVWENGFGDHKLQQLRRMARLSLPEKLRWLEEAHDLVRRLEAARKSEAK